MKVKESYWREAAKEDKNEKPNWTDKTQRQTFAEQTADAASKLRQTDSPLKDEMKFANILQSAAKLQKPDQRHDDSSEDRRDDQKKEKKTGAQEKDSAADHLAENGRAGKYDSFGGQAGGGQGFGMGGNINQAGLSENFAARSILHIADLERLVSIIRTQINLGGQREIILQLKRSVLEGLQVKILTDPAARVQIEFLAANEKVRQQIESHSQELAGILRGRGINLETLKTTIDSGSRQDGEASSFDLQAGGKVSAESNEISGDELLAAEDNTFTDQTKTDGKFYNA